MGCRISKSAGRNLSGADFRRRQGLSDADAPRRVKTTLGFVLQLHHQICCNQVLVLLRGREDIEDCSSMSSVS